MTYIPRFDTVRTVCLSDYEVQSSNWFPPMMREPRLAHLAECKECYKKLKKYAKLRVNAFMSQKRDKTKLELTQAKNLLEQRP